MDALNLFRNAVTATRLPIPTTSSDPSSEPSPSELAEATHLYFAVPSPHCLPLDNITRFTQSSGDQIDLRSIYLAYLCKDDAPQEYLQKFTDLNAKLPAGQQAKHLNFVEKLELVSWLDGAEGTEFVKPLEATADDVTAAADAATGAVPVVSGTGVGVTQTSVNGRPVKVIDARLQTIYNGERKMGDRNTVLRGIKPTDFSHVRKHKDTFLPKKDKGRDPRAAIPTRTVNNPAAKPAIGTGKRVDPIILLSPSASSLLRMSNIKAFLEEGLYVPFDHERLANMGAANLLHLTRKLHNLGEKPFRFVLVDGPEQFKPEYWDRVVAVFTTGQTWQFRSYKWREPQALFERVLGIYVGEKGQPVPSEVKGWGSNVKTFMVDRWDERSHGSAVDQDTRLKRRWKDRESVEELWRAVEAQMKSQGRWVRN
ncbi:uncharacterized protein HMPREF1541_00220 [Cyphellophora europaea CBS 101466]|uniref:Cell division control protein 73 C-terminal domain-containing protein n=1 Tax=Cyphellophora europaea (strain CBS 101466) TaxID=1220924 RepID=W2SBG0_CYPE1|nr:uncharacterized protein HMPREF1541_00220 [Cyphellophora europaea CBS 101466]ETN46037.1 hypothetical protein HMPREF1541_00220 [Cyphellophora europaea CBS 101466]